MTTFDSWESELYHFGVKGQKWGVQRYQNEDGTLTMLGRHRLYKDLRYLGKKDDKNIKKGHSEREGIYKHGKARKIHESLTEFGKKNKVSLDLSDEQLNNYNSFDKKAYSKTQKKFKVYDTYDLDDKYREKALLYYKKQFNKEAKRYGVDGNMLLKDVITAKNKYGAELQAKSQSILKRNANRPVSDAIWSKTAKEKLLPYLRDKDHRMI